LPHLTLKTRNTGLFFHENVVHEKVILTQYNMKRISKSGFTLVEMAVVIAMILVLAGAASLGIKPYYAYRDGRAAGEMLRTVKAAQLMYLSDYPTTDVSNLTQAELVRYMPNGVWPTLPSLNGAVPTIIYNVFPPVISVPDPSGSTTDGLWDVGQY
jgi:prepilin-type N-terminal cleavage/methylation domain-containing protein